MLRGMAPALLALTVVGGCGGKPSTRLTAAAPAKASCLPHRIAPEPASESGPSTAGMTWLKGGVFQMGAKPLRPEEGPPRPTRTKGLWIDRTDVTNADFARFVRATGYVTLAERPLDPRAYPGLSADQLKPSAIVFVGATAPAGGFPPNGHARRGLASPPGASSIAGEKMICGPEAPISLAGTQWPAPPGWAATCPPRRSENVPPRADAARRGSSGATSR